MRVRNPFDCILTIVQFCVGYHPRCLHECCDRPDICLCMYLIVASLNYVDVTLPWKAGWWGPVYSDTLSAQDAKNCGYPFQVNKTLSDRTRTYSLPKLLWSRFVDLGCWLPDINRYATKCLVLSVPPHSRAGLGIFFTIIAFSYLRQMLDPSSPGNVIRDPRRSAVHPTHYNPPYGSAGYNPGYFNYPAPSGPPPLPEYDGKPPGYTGDGWEDMQKKNRDEESGGPSGERDVGSPRVGDARY